MDVKTCRIACIVMAFGCYERVLNLYRTEGIV